MGTPPLLLFVVIPIVVAALGIGFKAITTPALGDLEPVNLRGKTFLITGATSGLGRWQAETLHSWNASLVLPVRDVARGKELAERLAKANPHAPPPRVEQMDLNSFASVRVFAKTYTGPVDVLVHNAAALGSGELRRTGDGFEECLQVNYLSGFLLTSLLLDRIEVSPAGRIVHVSAKAHEWANMSVDTLRKDKVLDPGFTARQGVMGNLAGSYADSKLAQLLFHAALSRRLHAPAVTLALHPAIVKTGLTRDVEMHDITRFMMERVAFRIGEMVGFMQTLEDAPKTQVHVSTHPSLQAAGASGRYYSPLQPPLVGCGAAPEDCAMDSVSEAASNQAEQEQLFAVTCELLGLTGDGGMCDRTPERRR